MQVLAAFIGYLLGIASGLLFDILLHALGVVHA
jgi:hypothetical protein